MFTKRNSVLRGKWKRIKNSAMYKLRRLIIFIAVFVSCCNSRSYGNNINAKDKSYATTEKSTFVKLCSLFVTCRVLMMTVKWGC